MNVTPLHPEFAGEVAGIVIPLTKNPRWPLHKVDGA
jgi:hypothetical protein